MRYSPLAVELFRAIVAVKKETHWLLYCREIFADFDENSRLLYDHAPIPRGDT